jgi:hypothetical protein
MRLNQYLNDNKRVNFSNALILATRLNAFCIPFIFSRAAIETVILFLPFLTLLINVRIKVIDGHGHDQIFLKLTILDDII